MNLNTLNEFRHGIYGCFGNAKDALFNTIDALSSEANSLQQIQGPEVNAFLGFYWLLKR